MTPYDMIKAHLSKAVPFANHTGVVIEELAAGTARATLALRPEVSNHIGTMHAGAVFTLAEAASGAAMAGAFANSRARSGSFSTLAKDRPSTCR